MSSLPELVEYINRFNEIVEKREIANNLQFLKDYRNKKNRIDKESDNLRANHSQILKTYHENYTKHRDEIKILIEPKKEEELNTTVSIGSDAAYSGERFLKNAMFSTFLGVVFASFFTFRGDDLD